MKIMLDKRFNNSYILYQENGARAHKGSKINFPKAKTKEFALLKLKIVSRKHTEERATAVREA